MSPHVYAQTLRCFVILGDGVLLCRSPSLDDAMQQRTMAHGHSSHVLLSRLSRTIYSLVEEVIERLLVVLLPIARRVKLEIR
jgi:hypothetical protein